MGSPSNDFRLPTQAPSLFSPLSSVTTLTLSTDSERGLSPFPPEVSATPDESDPTLEERITAATCLQTVSRAISATTFYKSPEKRLRKAIEMESKIPRDD